MKKLLNITRKAFFDNALWIVGLGLMLSSSGIDGAYMAQWMPPGFTWLGYVLNTVADVSGMALTYYYGILLKKARGNKKNVNKAKVLLVAEFVAVAYSWFFSWRQLLCVLPSAEPNDYKWVAPVSAAFIPLLLAAVGWAQSQIFTPEPEEAQEQTKELAKLRRDNAKLEADNAELKNSNNAIGHTLIELRKDNAELKRTNAEQAVLIAELTPDVLECPHCGAKETQDGKPFLKSAQLSAHIRHCKAQESAKE